MRWWLRTGVRVYAILAAGLLCAALGWAARGQALVVVLLLVAAGGHAYVAWSYQCQSRSW